MSKRYTEFLNNLNTIAVREQSGVELVKQLTGREAQLVVDPTLLLNKTDWNPYMKPVKGISPFNYVLVNELLPSQIILDIAVKVGKEKNIPVYCICKRAYGIKKNPDTINI